MIWGDDGETGDHIVPFKVRSEQLNRKEQSDEESKKSKPADQNISGTKIYLHDHKLGNSSGHVVDEGISQRDFCMSSWPHSSLSNAIKADPDSSATELSKSLPEPARYNSTRGGAFLETVMFYLGTLFLILSS